MCTTEGGHPSNSTWWERAKKSCTCGLGWCLRGNQERSFSFIKLCILQKDWMTTTLPLLINEYSMPVKVEVGVKSSLVCMNILCIYLSIFNCSLNCVYFTLFQSTYWKKKLVQHTERRIVTQISDEIKLWVTKELPDVTLHLDTTGCPLTTS